MTRSKSSFASPPSSRLLGQAPTGRASPIDSVTPDISDDAGLSREAEAARRLGFGAKLLIHPRQVAIARRIFSPSEAEVVWAQRVIAALEAADAGEP